MKDNISKIRTVCKKCKRIVNVIHWSPFGADYICDVCGYISKEHTERIKEKDIENDK